MLSREMLIRKPVNEAFDAFVKPETIQRFRLQSTSGPLGSRQGCPSHSQERP